MCIKSIWCILLDDHWTLCLQWKAVLSIFWSVIAKIKDFMCITGDMSRGRKAITGQVTIRIISAACVNVNVCEQKPIFYQIMYFCAISAISVQWTRNIDTPMYIKSCFDDFSWRSSKNVFNINSCFPGTRKIHCLCRINWFCFELNKDV